MKPIDFVIIWVDGNDPLWQKEKARLKKKPTITSKKGKNELNNPLFGAFDVSNA